VQVASEGSSQRLSFDYLVLADGFRSALRPQTSIRLVGRESSDA